MNRKILAYIGVSLLVLLLMAGLFNLGRMSGNSVQQSKTSDAGLGKYRSNEIPEECKVPQGQDIQSWKEHLGHHQNTLYCLDYYK